MDERHHLNAPHDDELSKINQLDDHSGLSNLYRKAKDAWEGEIVTKEERERRRTLKGETASFGIRKRFIAVGLLAPLPLALLSLFLAFIFANVTEQNASIMVIPLFILFGVWGILTLIIVSRTFGVFYQYGIRSGPFIVVLLLLLALSLPIAYIAVVPISSQLIVVTSLVVAAELTWSIVLCSGLLFLWTTPRLRSVTKVWLVILTAAVLLAASALLILSVI